MVIIKIKIFTRGENFPEVVFNSQPTVLSFSSGDFGSPTDLVEDRTCHVDKEYPGISRIEARLRLGDEGLVSV